MKDFYRLYDTLADCVKSGEPIVSCGQGRMWSMVETRSSSGIAMTTPGASIAPMYPEGFEGLSLREAAKAASSWNLEEASCGLAAVNAALNTVERIESLGCYEPFDNYCTAGLDFSGRTVGLIGHLKGPGEMRDSAKRVYIIERNPQEGDYPDAACEWILPRCDIVLITGSSIVNKTLPRLMELCENAYTILVGPSVPLCPELLELGFDRIAGMAVSSREKIRSHVLESKNGTPYVYGMPFMIKK